MRSSLTPRELEVLVLAAEGLTYRAIADRLGIAPITVAHVLRGVRQRLRARTTAQAAAVAYKRGEIS